MEVTLEKIELVKDRTGVTYKEAKEALEAAEGNVVDAIVAIEDKTDGQTSSEKFGAKGGELLGKMKEVVKRGNVARILIKKDEEILLNLPLNAGIVGAVVAPWGVILGVCASFGFKCKIEFVKDDGEVVDITDKAGNIYETAKEKGTEVYDQVKEKAPGVYDQVKEKGEAAVNRAKDFAQETANKLKTGKEKAGDAADEVKDAVSKEPVDLDSGIVNAGKAADAAKDAISSAGNEAAEKVEEVKEGLSDLKDGDL